MNVLNENTANTRPRSIKCYDKMTGLVGIIFSSITQQMALNFSRRGESAISELLL